MKQRSSAAMILGSELRRTVSGKVTRLAIPLIFIITVCFAVPWAHAFTHALDDGSGENALGYIVVTGNDTIWPTASPWFLGLN